MTEKGLEKAIKAAVNAKALGCTVGIHGVPVELRKPHWNFWNLPQGKVATSTIIYNGQEIDIYYDGIIHGLESLDHSPFEAL